MYLNRNEMMPYYYHLTGLCPRGLMLFSWASKTRDETQCGPSMDFAFINAGKRPATHSNDESTYCDCLWRINETKRDDVPTLKHPIAWHQLFRKIILMEQEVDDIGNFDMHSTQGSFWGKKTWKIANYGHSLLTQKRLLHTVLANLWCWLYLRKGNSVTWNSETRRLYELLRKF